MPSTNIEQQPTNNVEAISATSEVPFFVGEHSNTLEEQLVDNNNHKEKGVEKQEPVVPIEDSTDGPSLGYSFNNNNTLGSGIVRRKNEGLGVAG